MYALSYILSHPCYHHLHVCLATSDISCVFLLKFLPKYVPWRWILRSTHLWKTFPMPIKEKLNKNQYKRWLEQIDFCILLIMLCYIWTPMTFIPNSLSFMGSNMWVKKMTKLDPSDTNINILTHKIMWSYALYPSHIYWSLCNNEASISYIIVYAFFFCFSVILILTC